MALRRPCGTALHEAKGSCGEGVEEAEKTVEAEDVLEEECSEETDEGDEEEVDGEAEEEVDGEAEEEVADVEASVF